MNEDKAIFIRSVQSDSSVPAAVRQHVESVQGLERRICDQSYLDFLREQIALAPRGPGWTAILTARLAAFSPFCGFPLLAGTIYTQAGFCVITVDPSTSRVVRHEEYESTGIA